MKKKLLTVIMTAALSVSMICACGGGKSASEPAPAADKAQEETVEEEAPAEEEAAEEEAAEEEVAEESGDAEAASDVTYVDGFYANSGNDDFMIFFYETSAGDLAYVNDGTNEAVAEYTVEEAALDDGTPYLVVTVGNVTLGYYEDGEDIYIVDNDGNAYAAAQLSEDEAEELHSMVTE